MMGSTVIDEQTPDSCLEELRLLVNSEFGGHKTVVLVEGDDDVKVYKPMFDGRKVDFSVAGSCALIPQTIRLVCSDDMLRSKVIGIKDADFDHLMDICYDDIPNLFLTDTHDAETLMLTDSVMKRICYETMSCENSCLLSDALNALEYYSYIRYYNAKVILSYPDKDGLLFDGFKLHKVYDGENVPTLHDWYERVRFHGNNHLKDSFPEEAEVDAFVRENRTDDWLNLTRGHDLIYVIMKRIHALCPLSQRYGETHIASFMRVAYSLDEFRATELYRSIDSWANSRELYLWTA